MIKKIVEILEVGYIVKRKQPICLTKIDSLFYNSVNPNIRAIELYKYKNVSVTPEGNVFKGFNLDKDLLIYPRHRKKYNLLYILSSLIKRKKISCLNDNTYLLCTDYWSNSIFHWMCDTLPRIEAVKGLAESCVFILPKFYEYPYILETLKAYNFKSILLIEDTTYLKCKNLIVPKQVTVSGQINSKNICAVQKTLLEYFEPKRNNAKQYIYISRSKAKYRKVLNEEEIAPILKSEGFDIIYFEDLSVQEQVELCFNAKAIVSIHGANLTNVIFMQPYQNVLEFRMNGDVLNNYYYELADSIGCNYYYMCCGFEDPKPNTNTFDLYVDPIELEIALKKIK